MIKAASLSLHQAKTACYENSHDSLSCDYTLKIYVVKRSYVHELGKVNQSCIRLVKAGMQWRSQCTA